MTSPPTGILFYDPRDKPTSTTGTFQQGCYRYFYYTGTLTLAPIYSDGNLSVPLGQPVTAGSDGRFTQVYLDPSITYRVKLFNSGNSQLDDTDPFVVPSGLPTANQIGEVLYPQTAAELAAGVTPTNYAYPPYNVLRYGADPSGVASSVTAFDDAYSAAMAELPQHAAVYIPAGKYLIPSPGLSWTNQNDIALVGDGPNMTVLTGSGSNYTILSISADTGAGTTGTNLRLQNFGISAGSGFTGVSGIYLADYFTFYLGNLQLYTSGNSLKMAGMALGVVDNVNAQTAGTNAAGNSALLLTTDTDSVACGPIIFNGGNFNGQSSVTAGGAVWTKGTFGIVFNSTLFTAFGGSLTSVFAATNNDDITINGGYSESGRNTSSSSTAVLFDLGVTAACQNFKLNGGTYFAGASGKTLNYGILAHNTQALSVEGATFSGFNTAAIKYTVSTASMINLKNVYSSGSGGPPVLDSSTNGPNAGYLKSWNDPWPRLDASLVGTGVTAVTGDGTAYTVLFDTANFDTTSMYASGTGIATVPTQGAGMYDVSVAVMINSLTTSYTNYQLDIVQKTAGGSVVTTHSVSTNPGVVKNAANQASLHQNCLLKCAGGDQIYVVVTVSGSSKSVGIVGAATEYTRLNVRYIG